MRVSIHMLRALAAAVERNGATVQAFLEQAALPATLLERPDLWLPVADFTRAVEVALALSADPALGLHLGVHAHHGMFQLPGRVVQHAPTLGEAIDQLVRYTGLLAEGFEPRVLAVGGRTVLRFARLSGESASVRAMAELGMVGVQRLLRQCAGPSARPERVCFAYRAPAHADAYRQVFGGRERFGQTFTEVHFDATWLGLSQHDSDHALYTWLAAHAEQQLALLQRHGTLGARVQQLLAARDQRALPAMGEAAEALGVSARTLARRLRDEGFTYPELIARRRAAEAGRLLEQPLLTLREVAEQMGFEDPAAFHKAWKRWTGLTPLQYRALKRGKGG